MIPWNRPTPALAAWKDGIANGSVLWGSLSLLAFFYTLGGVYVMIGLCFLVWAFASACYTYDKYKREGKTHGQQS